MICAAVAGTVVAGHCCVAPGSGLAGPAIALGYGLITAVVAGALAGLLAIFLPPRALVGTALVMGVPATVLGGMTLKGYWEAREQMQAHLQEGYARMPAFRVELTFAEADEKPPFQRIAFDWSARRYTVTANGQRCTAKFTGPQGVAMLGALRSVEGILHEDPYPCAGTLGAVQHELDMSIPEPTSPNSKAKLALTAACLTLYPTLAEPLAVARRIHDDRKQPMRCEQP